MYENFTEEELREKIGRYFHALYFYPKETYGTTRWKATALKDREWIECLSDTPREAMRLLYCQLRKKRIV